MSGCRCRRPLGSGQRSTSKYRVKIAEEAFRKINDVKVKWLSLEPLLQPLKFNDLSMFDWVVIGSQSATKQPAGYVKEFAPPFEWVADIVTQARKAGCRIYMKPNLLGDNPNPQSPGMKLIQEVPDVPPLVRPQGAPHDRPHATRKPQAVDLIRHRGRGPMLHRDHQPIP